MKKIKVHNVEPYASKHECWVIRDGGNEGYWMWGAYDDPIIALQAAKELNNGITVHRDWCEMA